MDVRLVNKYIPFVDRISDSYQYPANIQHLLYLVIPAFIEKLKKISKDNNIDFYISISATNEQLGDVNMEGCQILN